MAPRVTDFEEPNILAFVFELVHAKQRETMAFNNAVVLDFFAMTLTCGSHYKVALVVVFKLLPKLFVVLDLGMHDILRGSVGHHSEKIVRHVSALLTNVTAQQFSISFLNNGHPPFVLAALAEN